MQTRVAAMVMLVLLGMMAVVIAVRLARGAVRYLERVAAFAAALAGCPPPAPAGRRPAARQAWPLRPTPGWRRSGHPLHH